MVSKTVRETVPDLGNLSLSCIISYSISFYRLKPSKGATVLMIQTLDKAVPAATTCLPCPHAGMSKAAAHGDHVCPTGGHREVHKYVQKVWKSQSDGTAPVLPKNCPTAYRKENDASKITYLKQCNFQLKGRKTHTHTQTQVL